MIRLGHVVIAGGLLVLSGGYWLLTSTIAERRAIQAQTSVGLDSQTTSAGSSRSSIKSYTKQSQCTACSSPLLLNNQDLTGTLTDAVIAAGDSHGLYAVTAAHTPCGGFLSKQPYYIRPWPATDVSLLQSVNTECKFAFLSTILGASCYALILHV